MKIKLINLNLCATCNFQCVMCPHSHHLGHYDNPNLKTFDFMKLKKSYASKQTIKNLMDSIQKEHLRCFTIQWIGESLLHPNFLNIFEYICKRNYPEKHFGTFVLNTNASRLNTSFNKKFIGIIKKYDQRMIITFSLDAIKQGTFTAIKRSDLNINKILNNCKHFVLNSPKSIRIIEQTLVLNENFKELYDFYLYWKTFFLKHSLKYKVIYALNEQQEGINNYIFFRKAEPFGSLLWEKFMEIKQEIDKNETMPRSLGNTNN